MTQFTNFDILTISPMLVVILTAMIVLLIDLFLPRDRKSILVVLSLFGLVGAGISIVTAWDSAYSAFGGSVSADNFSLIFQGILIIVTAISIALSEKYIQTKGINYGEYYALMLFSASGAMLMAASKELITTFVGLEVLSIALYILSGFARTEPRSEESAMKYFLLGAFSSAFFLYGIALIYGGAHTTRLDATLINQFKSGNVVMPYAVAGAALLLVGLGFKAAIVPFHSWTPDVYEGAPTSVTAFMSAGAKAGAFAALIRVMLALLPIFHFLTPVIWVLAVLTMALGNAVALLQTNLKRMLAYSSIAHAGYILVGLVANNGQGVSGIIFYVLVYAFMNLGAFGALIMLARRGQELVKVSDLRGLGRAHPAVAALMTIFMLSLAGIPPTAGFFGKLFLFAAAVDAHQYALAVIGLVVSVIGVVYYLNVIANMWIRDAEVEFPAKVWGHSVLAEVAVVICALFTLGLGVFSSGSRQIAQMGIHNLIEDRYSPVVAQLPVSSTVVSHPVVAVVSKEASLPH